MHTAHSWGEDLVTLHRNTIPLFSAFEHDSGTVFNTGCEHLICMAESTTAVSVDYAIAGHTVCDTLLPLQQNLWHDVKLTGSPS